MIRQVSSRKFDLLKRDLISWASNDETAKNEFRLKKIAHRVAFLINQRLTGTPKRDRVFFVCIFSDDFELHA